MAKSIEAGADALVVDAADHVATALKDLRAGATIKYRLGTGTKELVLKQDIPFGHKVALEPIAAGTSVKKYGEVIGRSTADIQAGEHVHVHNIEGIRGRGDQPTGGETHAGN